MSEVEASCSPVHIRTQEGPHQEDPLSQPIRFPHYHTALDFKEPRQTETSPGSKASTTSTAPVHNSTEEPVIKRREDSPVHSPLLG